MAAGSPLTFPVTSRSVLSNLISEFLILSNQNQLFFFSIFAFFLSFSLSVFFFCRRLRRRPKTHNNPLLTDPSLAKLINGARKTGENGKAYSLLLDIFPGALTSGDVDKSGSGHGEERDGSVEDLQTVKKKKKKRAKKKRLLDLKSEENGFGGDSERERQVPGSRPGRVKPELVCLYPFTSTSSATQRKIKHQYDQLVKCNESNALTLAQVGEFANCLIEARTELQHKSEVIKRKFTITKALLFKADRSSIDRLRQQIYKLELEQKRLEEDTFVYNWLQQQLKLSPAYQKMLEISACVESKAKSEEVIEMKDHEFGDISFEELLAQEKKDVFWQKNGKLRTYSS
ncbi:hypothetical protein OIU76_004667 [Salix suchowensis]|uniref:AT1G17665-like protein n=1 Tax=Salix suchowensis TaxID=1278906 RepID=A0ABQ9BV65_9ROSI|nr:beta-galactosidase [Salix suchowensis]KAJ6327597.1 hypothetical protein OIU78_014457 [Salix suchowensis]KAJ6348244.1 hypothetical protein OIU76_004667 [Salix suchowensis]KAJ6389523.1 hypothetical protein OIU77_027781 [Salix suchowensis]